MRVGTGYVGKQENVYVDIRKETQISGTGGSHKYWGLTILHIQAFKDNIRIQFSQELFLPFNAFRHLLRDGLEILREYINEYILGDLHVSSFGEQKFQSIPFIQKSQS